MSITVRRTNLDFDGTLTDVKRETAPYEAAYRQQMGDDLGFEAQEFERIWTLVRDRIEAAPTKFGWEDEGTGRIMAPATAEPMILVRTIAKQILQGLLENPQSLGLEPSKNLKKRIPKNGKERGARMEDWYLNNYQSCETHFRPGAGEFLKRLNEFGGYLSRLAIVTNANPHKVLKKLDLLRETAPRLPPIRVIGGAQKAVLDTRWNGPGIPDELDLRPHLERAVQLQRKIYYETLAETGIFQSDGSAIMVGDVWELDLALPMASQVVKGAFITRPETPAHELAIVRDEVEKGRAAIANDLEELYGKIVELHAA